jgi:hypothetical protein
VQNMFHPQNPQQVREFFYNAWTNKANGSILSDLELLAIDCINMHPHYHKDLSSMACIHEQFSLQDNPFLHLSMHLAVIEQMKINQPDGILALGRKLIYERGTHDAMHVIIDCLQQLLLENMVGMSDKQINELYLSKINRSIVNENKTPRA